MISGLNKIILIGRLVKEPELTYLASGTPISHMTLTVKELGGIPSSSVNRQTGFVVIGKDPGSKYEKAREFGVPILDEEQFLKIVKEAELEYRNHIGMELKNGLSAEITQW